MSRLQQEPVGQWVGVVHRQSVACAAQRLSCLQHAEQATPLSLAAALHWQYLPSALKGARLQVPAEPTAAAGRGGEVESGRVFSHSGTHPIARQEVRRIRNMCRV